MEPDTAPPQDAWRIGRGPFIFSGVPPLCVGDIDLINESDEKVRVRKIAVVGGPDTPFASLGVTELRFHADDPEALVEAARARLAARLPDAPAR